MYTLFNKPDYAGLIAAKHIFPGIIGSSTYKVLSKELAEKQWIELNLMDKIIVIGGIEAIVEYGLSSENLNKVKEAMTHHTNYSAYIAFLYQYYYLTPSDSINRAHVLTLHTEVCNQFDLALEVQGAVALILLAKWCRTLLLLFEDHPDILTETDIQEIKLKSEKAVSAIKQIEMTTCQNAALFNAYQSSDIGDILSKELPESDLISTLRV